MIRNFVRKFSSKLTHVNNKGEASMINVCHKNHTLRKAIARCTVHLVEGVATAIRENTSKKGDVLVPATTTADAMGIAVARSLNENNVVIGGDINVIRTRNKFILADYLALLISNPPLKIDLASYAKGANILHISNNDIRNLKIPLPPIETQQQIVAQIEAEQALIESAKKLIEIYEQKIKEVIAKIWEE